METTDLSNRPATQEESTTPGLSAAPPQEEINLPVTMPEGVSSPVAPPPIDQEINLPVKAPQLEGDYYQAIKHDPDRAAKIYGLMQKLNQPAAFIDNNLEAMEKVANAPDPSFFVELEKNYPGTSKWLKNPKNLATSHDEMKALSDIENQVQDYGFFHKAWRTLGSGTASALSDVAKVPGHLGASFVEAYNSFNTGAKELRADGRNPGLISSNPLARYFSEDREPLNKIPDSVINNPVSEHFKAQAKRLSPEEAKGSIYTELSNGNIGEAARVAFFSAIQSAPQTLGIIAASASGAPLLGLLAMGETSAAGKYAESKDKPGVSNKTALLNSYIHGGAEAAFEQVGTLSIVKSGGPAIKQFFTQLTDTLGIFKHGGPIFKQFGEKPWKEATTALIKLFAKNGFWEGAEEVGTGAVQDVSDYLMGINPNALDGFFEKRINEFAVGALSSTMYITPAAIATHAEIKQKIEGVKKATEFYTAVGNGVDNLKLTERSKEQLKEYIEHVTDGTPVTDVHIPAEKFDEYFQDKADDAAKELGVEKELEEARTRGEGASVKIPYATFLQKFSGTEHIAALARDVKFDADGHTPNEIDKVVEEAKLEAQAQEKKAVEGNYAESAKRIGDDLTKQAIAAGRPAKEAIAFGKLHEQAWLVAATKQGIDPEVLRARLNEIRVESTEESARLSQAKKILKETWASSPDAFTSEDAAIANVKTTERADALSEYFLEQSIQASERIKRDGEKSSTRDHIIKRDSDNALSMLDKIKDSLGEGSYNQALLNDQPQRLTWETIPSSAVGAEINNASHGAKQKFTQETSAIIHSGGRDVLAEKLGISVAESDPGSGGYAGSITPNVITGFQNATPEQIKNYARAVQYIFKQDAVPFFEANKNGRTEGMLFTFSEPIDIAKEKRLFELLKSLLSPDAGYTRLNDTEIVVLNFEGRPDFLHALTALGETHGKELQIGSFGDFSAEADYGPVHDWKSDPTGEALRAEASSGGSSDLQSWLDSRRELYEELLTKWSGENLKREEARPERQVETYNQRNLSPLGFYSALEEAVSGMDFKTSPAKDLSNRIKNLPGIKSEEVNDMGLHEWLSLKAATAINGPITTYEVWGVGDDMPTHRYHTKEKAEAALAHYEKNGLKAEIRESVDRNDGKVTKEEVLEFIKAKGVKVEQKMLAEDYVEPDGDDGDIKASDLDWDEEPEHIGNDYDDDPSSEWDYYRKESDHFDEVWEKNWREENESEYKNDDGSIDEASLTKAMEKDKDDEASRLVDEMLADPESSSAKFRLEENHTGETLEGSDERGWYFSGSGDFFETSLEEAKVRAQAWILKGNQSAISETIKAEEITWNAPTGTLPSRETIFRKAKALVKTDLARLEIAAKEKHSWRYDPTDKDNTPEEIAKNLKEDTQEIAEDEVTSTYLDPSQKKNTVNYEMKHPLLSGKLTGNNHNGYVFEVKGRRSYKISNQIFHLHSKDVNEAKAEALDVMKEKEIIGGGKKSEPDANVDVNAPTGETQYTGHMRRGGKNRRELLITVPDFSPKFTDGHFREPNVVVHLLLTDKVDPATGKKYIEASEVQSDLHQKGREQGYREERPDLGNFSQWMKSARPEITDEEVSALFNDESSSEKKQYLAENESELKNNLAVPSLPFKNTEAWLALGMKRLMHIAVTQGYDGIAWAPASSMVQRWGTEVISWKKSPPTIVVMSRRSAEDTWRAVGTYKNRSEAQEALVAETQFGAEAVIKEFPEHYLVAAQSQSRGFVQGIDLEAAARERGLLVEESGKRVTTKEELFKVIERVGSNDSKTVKLTDSIWERMQSGETEGTKKPRQEGYEFEYDHMLPKKVMPAILKKLDPQAKVSTGQLIGKDGELDDVWRVEFTDKLKEKILEGLPYFQDDNRGSILFEKNETIIKLFSTADASTLFHESGHYFLNMQGKLAAMSDSTPQQREDYEATLKFLGAKPGEKFTRKQHEKFARTFEAYLREGKAPSSALRSIFNAFRRWLTKLYPQAKKLNTELTPEITAVMDRMFATESEIKLAEEAIGHTNDILEGADPIVQARLTALAGIAHDQAVTTLLKPMMADLTEERKKFLEETRSEATKQAENEVGDLPVFRAMENIASFYEAKDPLGKKRDIVANAHKFIEGSLKDDANARYEEAAELYGFTSGEDLATQIVNAHVNQLRDTEIKSRVDAAMAPHADLLNSERIKEEALKAVHNEGLTELLAIEREALQDLIKGAEIQGEVSKRRKNSAKLSAAAIKEAAKNIMKDKPLKEAGKFQVYVTAERDAAIKAAKAIKAGKLEDAIEYKRQQALNHALASEALRNRDEIEKHLNYLSKHANRGNDLNGMPYGFTRQVDDLLSKVGLAEPRPVDIATNSQIASNLEKKGETLEGIANATGLKPGQAGTWQVETLSDFVTRVNDNFYSLTLPEEVFTLEKDFKALTMGELRALRTAAQEIISLGKDYDTFLTTFDKVDMKAAAVRFRESVEANVGRPHREAFGIGSAQKNDAEKLVKSILNLPDSFIPSLANVLTLCHYLDGKNENGPAKEYIYRPMKEAEDKKLARYKQMVEDVNNVFAKHVSPKELAAYQKESHYFPDFDSGKGRYLTREEIFVFALNWGNEGNRSRIRDGFSKPREGFFFTDEHAQKVLDKLTEKEWKLAQDIWNHLNSYWPEIVELETRLKGVTPVGVEASPVQTKYGTFEGGYFPISYDPEKSSDAYLNAEEKTALYKQYSSTNAHTDMGHTKERVQKVSRPVKLHMSVLFNHLENVIHDLSYREAVIDVNRFLRQKETKSAIENAVGVKGFNTFNEWLKSIASDQGEHLSGGEQRLRWFRFSTTFAQLGFRFINLPIDVTGNLANTWWELGPVRTGKAIAEFAASPLSTIEFIHEKSQRMRHRAEMRERDVSDIARKWQGENPTKRALKQYMFIFQTLADKAVAYPLWAEVYKHNLSEHGEAKAIHIADEAISRTVGSGSILDQVGAQRGSEMKKLSSMYYSWASMMFNRCWLEFKMAGLEVKRGHNLAAATIIANTAFFAWGLQALNEVMWREFFRNAPEPDEEARKKRIAASFLKQPFGYFWLGRDIGGAAIDYALGNYNASYKLSPIESALSNVLEPLGKGANIALSENKEFDHKYAESAARASATMLGYPQKLNDMTFNFLDWQRDEGEATWRDLINRRTKK